jgi:hypothetical protein
MDGLLGVARMIITSDEMDHSRKFPAFSTSKKPLLTILTINFSIIVIVIIIINPLLTIIVDDQSRMLLKFPRKSHEKIHGEIHGLNNDRHTCPGNLPQQRL